MMPETTQVELARADVRRAACVLVHRHGEAAPVRADVRYRLLSAQQASAASIWREIRDYLARARRDPVQWRELGRTAYPDAITHLSGSHNGPINEPIPS